MSYFLIVMLNVVFSYCYAECCYAECRYVECLYAEYRYAECRYAECHDAECRGTKRSIAKPIMLGMKEEAN